ncbi:MAG: 50S ribosomal protein L7ae [Firmicutes bacterium]|nr:50S ribosomal protein L7ae [Bacillota bacterium]
MNKIYNYLGLAQRAGRLASGEYAVEGQIRKNKVALLIIAADAALNTLKKFSSLAENQKLKFYILGKKEMLGHAIGKSPRAVLGVLDQGFAAVIQNRIKELGREES